jgi:hypothetical protein
MQAETSALSNAERRELMFDFPRWREWQQQKFREFRVDGLNADIRVGPDDSPKPGMAFGIVGVHAMATFESWATGECDITIMALPSPHPKMVFCKWGIVLTDETFESAFAEFLAEFRRFEVSN